MMYNIFISHVILLFAARCQNNSASEEDTKVLEECEFPYFSPFMANFRKHKKDVSDAAKVAFLSADGMETLRNNELMQGLIERMFDFEREVAEMEREIFSQPIRVELTFKYIDVFPIIPSIF